MLSESRAIQQEAIEPHVATGVRRWMTPSILVTKHPLSLVSFRWRERLLVLIFLLSTRILVNIAGLIGANLGALRGGVAPIEALNPHSLPGIWARWDAGYYLYIANHGYTYHGANVGFLPAYPLIMWLVVLGTSSLLLWAGFVVSNLSFLIAGLLLWDQVRRDMDGRSAWATITTLGLFPTAFFFSAIYTEGLFLLLSVLVYWLSARKQYLLAALCISLGSITRWNGILLVIVPVVELLHQKSPRPYGKIAMTGLVAVAGSGLYGWYSWHTQASAFAYFSAEKDAGFGRSITFPWRTLADSFAVIISGRGGFQSNWFMRAVSMQDFIAAVLLIICSIVAIPIVRKSLSIYLLAALGALLCAHGPFTLGLYSLSRYVIVLFPAFIVMGVILSRRARLSVVVWTCSAILSCFLAGWFASGRWVA